MADNVKPRVKVPSKASAGEVVTLKTLISHPMESGQRKDKDGNVIPRSIINRFTCDFNGQNVIDITIEPAVSTNPYFEFEAKVDASGEFKFTWYDDDGSVYEDAKSIEVA
ncbi:thiosulfate oxidation carrier complex protein SoxZ [Pontitalea aquivivens]|uniref:thiosulfate oxidation carrier complex protein SoxZ n=1 Tax=Pontitalea aquivivens TaxID=3388663 RepID=UPI0039706574